MPSFDELKGKYQPVIDFAKTRGVHLKNVNIEPDNKLLIRGDAPNQDVKNEVWNKIKAIDPTYSDLTADINVDPSLPQPPAPEQFYEVAPGDNLSKIAKKFYGNANEYQRIFEANRDQLSDPDKIKVGQRLKIPPQ